MEKSTWQLRHKLWIEASHKLALKDDPFICLEIQNLGMAERLLLAWEQRAVAEIARQQRGGAPNDETWMVNDLLAISRLWIFGLYETLRTYKQKVGGIDAPNFTRLKVLFRKLERLRMPLAKHESKGGKGMSYPDSVIMPTTGQIGWNTYSSTGDAECLFRTKLADEFLGSVLCKDIG